jgi:hypothetical protein
VHAGLGAVIVLCGWTRQRHQSATTSITFAPRTGEVLPRFVETHQWSDRRILSLDTIDNNPVARCGAISAKR